LLGVEASLLASKTLDDNFRLLVDQNAHVGFKD
jgi:hypothetical protein